MFFPNAFIDGLDIGKIFGTLSENYLLPAIVEDAVKRMRKFKDTDLIVIRTE